MHFSHSASAVSHWLRPSRWGLFCETWVFFFRRLPALPGQSEMSVPDPYSRGLFLIGRRSDRKLSWNVISSGIIMHNYTDTLYSRVESTILILRTIYPRLSVKVSEYRWSRRSPVTDMQTLLCRSRPELGDFSSVQREYQRRISWSGLYIMF